MQKGPKIFFKSEILFKNYPSLIKKKMKGEKPIKTRFSKISKRVVIEI